MAPGNLAPPTEAVVHPLVLLSVVDHYNRVASDTNKRVVGILLGERSKGVIHITNSYALPFEEDDRDQKVWYVDHIYLETMFNMFRKVNASEKIVGYYSTGPRLKESDTDINELLSCYADWALLVICEVQPKNEGLPVTAYYCQEQVREDGTQKAQKTFVNIPTSVGATEAEEVGVEHLLRDAKDNSIGTLSTNVERILGGLGTLKSRLLEVQQYLQLVVAGKLPVNHDIIYNLQDAFNLLPNISPSLQQSFATKSNDMQLVIYVASLIRSVLALHNLISNKEQRVDREKKAAIKTETSKEKEDDKTKEGSKDESGSKAKRLENGKANGKMHD